MGLRLRLGYVEPSRGGHCLLSAGTQPRRAEDDSGTVALCPNVHVVLYNITSYSKVGIATLKSSGESLKRKKYILKR